MTRGRLLLTAAGFIGLVTFAGYEIHSARELRIAAAVTNDALQHLRSEAAALRREQVTMAAELATAEQQLAAAAPAQRVGTAAAYPAEITRWLNRVKHLRRLFEENSDQVIPEMNLLTDDDWLRVGQAVKFNSENDIRRALAAVRVAACQRFCAQLTPALRAYTAAFPNAKPASVHALLPFFISSPDPAILARYELQDPSGPRGYGPSTWFVQNKSPVDIVYDTRFRVAANSSFLNDGAHAWIPDFFGRYQAATNAYSAANHGRPPDRSTDTLPFFNPPLTSDAAAALLKSEHGK
jgi:hypothetical protein